MKYKSILIVSILSLVISYQSYSQNNLNQETKSSDTCRCIQSSLDLRASAVENIFLHPTDILEDVELFWKKDDTYQWVKSWHEYNNIPVDYDDWKRILNIINGYSLKKRQNSKAMIMVNNLKKLNDKFTLQAIPHICSFLPVKKEMLNTTVRLATYIYPRAFCVGDNIVQDIMNDYYEGDVNHMMNTILHEVFHVGYGRNHLHRTGTWIEPRSIYTIVQNLQNEGMATYCAYTARSIFPVKYDQDYAMLEDISEVRNALSKINQLFEKAPLLTPEELHSEAFKIGVDQRAYYVAGGFMAQAIDTLLGRDALANTVLEGPRSFIDTYNKTVDHTYRIVSFNQSVQISPLQNLRKMILDGNSQNVEKLLSELSPQDIGTTDFGEFILYNTGHMLRSNGNSELAIKLFEFCIQCYPGKDYQYKWLAQTLRDNGQILKAIDAYRKVLVTDPYDTDAREALANLEQSK